LYIFLLFVHFYDSCISTNEPALSNGKITLQVLIIYVWINIVVNEDFVLFVIIIFYEKLWILHAAKGCKLSFSTSQTAVMALLDCDIKTSNQQTESLYESLKSNTV